MIVGLLFLTIQHLDFTPPPQSLSEEDRIEAVEVQYPETQVENMQQREISILESNRDQSATNSALKTAAGNRVLSDVARDSLSLSQFGSQ